MRECPAQKRVGTDMSDTPFVPTLGLRHAVLWVTNPQASARFYEQTLGLVVKANHGDLVFLTSPRSATDHDLGLFKAASPSPPMPKSVGLYHLSWEVATLNELDAARDRLVAMGAYCGESDHLVSRSIYAQDPDGIEFEVMWEVPLDRLDTDETTTRPLNLDAAIAEFGADTLGRGAT